VTTDRGWKRLFEEPVPLGRGRQLVALGKAEAEAGPMTKPGIDADGIADTEADHFMRWAAPPFLRQIKTEFILGC
jgi:hypothetical protein